MNKFKIWDNKKKCFNDGPHYISNLGILIEEDQYGRLFEAPVHKIIVRSIGVRDKNTIECYVGDVCKVEYTALGNNFELTGVIWRKKGCFVIRQVTFGVTNLLSIERLGNKYENPELLELR